MTFYGQTASNFLNKSASFCRTRSRFVIYDPWSCFVGYLLLVWRCKAYVPIFTKDAQMWFKLKSYQTPMYKIAQKFIKKATKANYLVKRCHLETLEVAFLVRVICSVADFSEDSRPNNGSSRGQKTWPPFSYWSLKILSPTTKGLSPI